MHWTAADAFSRNTTVQEKSPALACLRALPAHPANRSALANAVVQPTHCQNQAMFRVNDEGIANVGIFRMALGLRNLFGGNSRKEATGTEDFGKKWADSWKDYDPGQKAGSKSDVQKAADLQKVAEDNNGVKALKAAAEDNKRFARQDPDLKPALKREGGGTGEAKSVRFDATAKEPPVRDPNRSEQRQESVKGEGAALRSAPAQAANGKVQVHAGGVPPNLGGALDDALSGTTQRGERGAAAGTQTNAATRQTGLEPPGARIESTYVDRGSRDRDRSDDHSR